MFNLSDNEKQTLLRIARESLAAHLDRGEKPDAAPESAVLRKKCGAFVTIKNRGALRGCIGLIAGVKPLYLTVAEMAVSAGTSDPRFDPVTRGELPDIRFEISALSPFEPLPGIGDIQIGRHGLLIKRGYNQGLLLPQVAEEYGWDAEQFLDNTCIKAGLYPGAWKEEGTEIQYFSAVVFGEEE